MNKLNKKNILHCAQFAADYKGNFISSLINLESELTKSNCNISYLFPKEVSEKLWYNEFSKSHKCYLSNNVYHSESEILKIINDDNIDIIHSHFEGFDISSVKAANKSKRDIKIVWHLHDHLSYVKNPIKKLYQIYCFYKHYNYYAKNVSIIAVSDEVKNFTLKYKSFLSSPFKFSRVIPNGIDINRIKSKGNSKSSYNKYSFLVLGGRNQTKRADLLVKAGLLLESTGGYCIKITNGIGTEDEIKKIFWEKPIPKWLQIIPQNSDINEIFNQADCFVSTSVAETFSYAICEATIYGLPIIQSNIEGTKWNETNPSVYIFKSEDIQDLADKMKLLMSTPKKELIDKCKITKQNNIKKYSINTWTKEIINFYSTLHD